MKGIPIIGVLPGSLAEAAGLRRGDSLLIVNERPITHLSDFIDARLAATESLTLTVLRAGAMIELNVPLTQDFPSGEHSATAIRSLSESLREILSEEPPTLH